MSNIKCQGCYSLFLSERFLLHHQKTANYCFKHKNIIFTCDKCLYTTKGMKNILSHQDLCTAPEPTKNCLDPFINYKEQISELKEKNQELEKQNNVEKIKNKILTNIIEKNTNISLDDDVSLTEQDNKYVNTRKASSSHFATIEEKPTTKKPSFRSIKSSIDLIDETSSLIKQSEYAKNVEEFEQEKLSKFLNIEDINQFFNQMKEYIENDNDKDNIEKYLTDFQKYRYRIFGKMSLEEYIIFLREQISKLETFLKSTKLRKQQINKHISKSLTGLESHLLQHNNYYNTDIDTDGVFMLKETIELHTYSPKEYVPFDINKIINSFYNYGLALFTLKENIQIHLINKYGYNNIIYLPMPKSNPKDPHNFYFLVETKKNNRYWNLDCRLENLTNNLTSRLLPYLIDIYRKIYKDIFKDNQYRDINSSKIPILHNDCQQLLENILLLAQPTKFSIMVRTLIMEKICYKPSINDKFNLYSDDGIQRKKFKEYEQQKKTNITQTLNQVFDNITSEQIDTILIYNNI